MGMFATEYHWVGRRLLLMVLASVLAMEIGKLNPLVGVEAQVPVPPGLGPPSPFNSFNFSSLPPISLPPGLPPGLPAIPPGLPAIPPAFAPIPSQYRDEANSKIKEFSSSFRKSNPDCFTRADEKNTFDGDAVGRVSTACAKHEVDFLLRICAQPEIDLYLNHITAISAFGVPPNINCNSTNWPKACNPGWAAATSNLTSIPDLNSTSNLLNSTLNPFNSTSIPLNSTSLPFNSTSNPFNSTSNPFNTGIPIRNTDSKTCCAGFFCPRGLTCMIPCPKGAHCPLAYFDPYTSDCIPYYYPALPGGNECGGADKWVNNKESTGMFCGGHDKLGYYCPDAITKTECQKGHFCRVGSTVQTKCSIFGNCKKAGLRSQSLKLFGILLIVILSVSLVVIYTCSDQCMHVRERRRNKARENAAQHAKHRASAAERWRAAKERTRKRTVRLTHALSGIKSEVCPSKTKVKQDATDPGIMVGWKTDNELEKREHVVNLQNPTSPQVVGSSQDSWSNDLYPEEGPRSVDLYDTVELPPVVSGVLPKEEGLPAVKRIKEVPKAWKAIARTRSQIYKYAYGVIEKEKVKQCKTTSWKELGKPDGFIGNVSGPTRLEMEIRFIDLCLVLKGTGKKILSYVTGELRPKRVTAVMGPSGAGKTTFLNAVAGKETGSVITGQVFINGVPGSIEAYKRIIGFVPQDDIVHGSLTVEENLAFSAKYRLPVDMPRRDRVLVVERIISRLNLASIRNSLVGTVENRGISGGQRKRVNVGLELVIEPSLLLLDEPTSGLDSTSSRLVVEALRREAALGVNVCLVVHQPSYGLFRMFDDVMLFAKGGHTVYAGPIDEMDAYFSSLRLEVPDRTNPPDYYMDVLEGEAMPHDDPSFDVKTLPILWMCHNGYRIPQEIQETADGKRMEKDDPARVSYDAPKTFIREISEELRVYALVRSDILKTSFSRVKNLSGRQTPGFFAQYFLILQRATKQRFRESRLVLQDYIILLLAGICLGILSSWQDILIVEQGYQYTLICLSLLVMIGSLRTFTVDKLQFWRESSSGVNKLAYFLAKDTVDHFNTVLKPLVYLSTFYSYSNPRASLHSTYVITLALTYCCTGIAYVVAILLKPQPGQLICVFLPVVATLLVSEPQVGVLETIQKISYAFWALQGYTISNAERYSGVWVVQRCLLLKKFGYSIQNFYKCVIILVCYGVGARILAFLCLIFHNKKRQK